MRLLIKQRVFSWTDTYDVYDQWGNPKYYVRAELLALGHHIHVYRKDTGEKVGAIHQRLLTLLPKFDVEINGEIVGTVHRELSLFVPKYSLDYKNWYIQGDPLEWNYQVCQGTDAVLYITREWLNWGDTYSLDFKNPEAEIPGLLLVLAIDASNCDH